MPGANALYIGVSTIIDGASAVVLCGHPRLGSPACAISVGGGMMGGKVSSGGSTAGLDVILVVGIIGVG